MINARFGTFRGLVRLALSYPQLALGQSATLRVLAKLAPGLTPGTAVALTAAGSLAFCCLAYLWVEKPLIARLRPLYRGTH